MKKLVRYKLRNEWFEKGLDYALKSWTSTFNRMGKPNPYVRIKNITVGIIAEKAVEQYLIDNNITYDKSGRTRWYEKDRYDLGIGEYAIDVKANYVNNNLEKIKISKSFEKSIIEWYNKCHALVPLDQFNTGNKFKRNKESKKVYIFPFYEGDIFFDNDNNALIHAFWDYKWIKRAEFKNLPKHGKLSIRYNGKEKGILFIYGTIEEKELVIEKINISNGYFTTEHNYYQVFSIRWKGEKAPDGKLTIKSPNLHLTETIFPENRFELRKNINNKYEPVYNDWQNLKLTNFEIIFTGWIHKRQMQMKGEKIPRFSKHIRQYSETKVDNFGCRVSDLNDMSELKTLIK
jgi:hypothetical protein